MPPHIVKRPRLSPEALVLTPPAAKSGRAGDRDAAPGGEGQSKAEQEARQLVEQARQEARRLLAAARAEAEGIRTREREAGYQAGYQEGLAKGQEEAERAVQEAAEAAVGEYLRRLGAIVEQARADRAALVRDAEADLVELALAIAEKALHQRLSAGERSAVMDIAREGLERLAAVGTDSARVRVHPGDYEAYRDVWDQLEIEGAAGVGCQVVPDERVEQGGCLVEARAGRIDGQWSTQLAQIRAALLGTSPETGPGGQSP